ncbi:sushi domain-containing protein 4-like [Ostrea edulis]|uniref:sushi domain-containing protein 4-like n=1 Tax=Ostrea edulis TaxID=37623 RepID=UPI002095C66F|nr:sushi domain-containing protein 4-like [Ostrea edulis]
MMKESYLGFLVVFVASVYHECTAKKQQIKEYHTVNSCGEFPNIANGQVKYSGIYATIDCDKGFHLKGDGTFKCDHRSGNHWSPSTRPQCLPVKGSCPVPSFNHGIIDRQKEDEVGVLYCADGYFIKWKDGTFRTSLPVDCYNDKWYFRTTHREQARDCEKVPEVRCEEPPTISHAKLDRFYGTPPYLFEGMKVHCMDGYKLIGESTVVCQETGVWSELPICVQKAGPPESCDVPIIPNGSCSCWTADSSLCTHVPNLNQMVCSCDSGYQTEGQQVLTCKGGIWDFYIPSCIVSPTEVSVGDNQEDNNSHMNTLAVVIATACSVLGLLLMVMVIVILRRKKPSHHHHQRLYDQGAMPPPYGRVHPIDEHDRVALIGYESARLPTYDEATRDPASQQVVNQRSAQEFRPLPNIPFQLRSPALPTIDSTSRHSITTTTTGNGEVFGSIDTVNFSMSDASTAGTVDTIDSRTSRPSHGSRTATAGSLESSRENLSSEDAPLLENNTLELNTETQDEVIEEEIKEF